MNLHRWQLLTCFIGLAASFLPCFSFTNSFWELGLSQLGEGPVRISRVTAGSPAEAAGLLAGDGIEHPAGFDGVQHELRTLRPGEKRSFAVVRQGEQLTVEIVGASPQLAAVWYAHVWYPIAGVLFLALCLLLFGTAPLSPPPYWRSILVAAAGLGLASGFALALIGATPFTRFRLWQRWLMGEGDDWSFGQGFFGLAAGLLLAIVAAAEVRARLTKTRPDSDIAPID